MSQVSFPLEAATTFVAFICGSVLTLFLFEMHDQMASKLPRPIPDLASLGARKLVLDPLFLEAIDTRLHVHLAVGDFGEVNLGR